MPASVSADPVFHDLENAALYQAIIDCHATGDPVDPVTVGLWRPKLPSGDSTLAFAVEIVNNVTARSTETTRSTSRSSATASSCGAGAARRRRITARSQQILSSTTNLAAFDHDIEKEGSPLVLGDKRIEGSTFPKSIRGSTPKIRGPIDKGGCQIEGAVQKSWSRGRRHIRRHRSITSTRSLRPAIR